ncbi:MAG: DNA polymerase I [Defluviitaleaceae bacterium]|nr:DNA polymerase I [Defluviitaleaceae bacterium]
MKAMLIDGNSIINRAFYGLPTLTNSRGEHTNGVYGFLNIFFKLYEEEMPDYVGVAFDLKGPTFRHKQYEAYKAGRKGMPDELASQLPVLKKLLTTMNIQVFEAEGYEADDILGTLADLYQDKGIGVVLISGDRDLLQLATPTVKVRIPKTKGGKTEVEDYYEKDVIESMGVTPKEYIDVKALMGDASDNIPGVPGIGEKTALKIISQYKSVEAALENYDKITPRRMGEALMINKDLAIMSKELATIITHAPVQDIGTSVSKEDIFNNRFKEELINLEFKSIVTRYFAPGHLPQTQGVANVDTMQTIFTKEELQTLMDDIKVQKHVGVGVVPFLGKVVGLSFAYENKGFFVEINQQLSKECILELFEEIKNGPKLIFLDSKAFLNFAKCDVHVAFDTYLAAYILNIESNLRNIAREILSISDIATDTELSGKGKNKKTFQELTREEQTRYGAYHGAVALTTHPIMVELIKTNNQQELYYNVELPLAKVLSSMEEHGIKIDRIALVNFDNKITQDIDRLTAEIHSLAGEKFNINSPSQMGIVLFEKLGLKGSKKTKTGYSTAAEVLEKLKNSHPIINCILEYRTLSKLKSTYCEGLMNLTDPQTDKIHTTFSQTVTSTGRLSSLEPNLQNIPIRMELGRQLRKVFIPNSSSNVFLDADYSQIELRIMAHLSQDPNMRLAYETGIDIHRATAAQVLGIPVEDVTDEQRSNAKAINFGIIYGIGAFSLAQDLKTTKKEAEQYINMYFEQYPLVKKYLEGAVASAKETGYGLTIFGRRRNIPELKSSSFIVRGFGERVAMNMPIQGSAADIMKIAMVQVYQRLINEGLQSRLILTVHDELLIEAKKDEVQQVKTLMKEEMENAAKLSIPLEVEVHEGETWYDAK